MSWKRTSCCMVLLFVTAPALAEDGTGFDSDKGLADRIKIGGSWIVRTQFDADTDVAGTRTEEANWSGEATLVVKAYATEDDFVNVKLDLEDFFDGSAGTGDDLLEELYFQWNKIGGKPFGLLFGKHEVAFGLDKGLYRNFPFTHASINVPTFTDLVRKIPGEVDNTFGLQAKVGIPGDVNLYLETIQNSSARGVFNNEPEDLGLFQSLAAKVDLDKKKQNGLYAQVSFINLHDESQTAQNQSALSVAAEYKPKTETSPLTVFTEYIAGFNWTYDPDISTDTMAFGVKYKIHKKVELGVLFEMAWISNDLAATYVKETYRDIAFGLSIALAKNSSVYVEYMMQQVNAQPSVPGPDDISKANRLEIGTKFAF